MQFHVSSNDEVFAVLKKEAASMYAVDIIKHKQICSVNHALGCETTLETKTVTRKRF